MTETAKRNKDSVRAFFRALETADTDTVAALFAEDGVHINPYHCGVFPAGAEGREAIRAYWAPTFPNFDGMSFPIHELCAMEGGEMVFARYSGRIRLKDGAGWYNNDYYSTFKFNTAGEITEYVEIFNPVTAARGFGLLDQLIAQG
jgi:ketosteroid isomerase-like protein